MTNTDWSCGNTMLFSFTDVFLPNSAHSTSMSQSDLNKENQKPICKSDKFAEADSHKNSSLDELEEGEIISDNEKPEPQRSFDKSAKPRASTEVQNTKTSPESRKSSVRLDKDNRKISSMKMHQTKADGTEDKVNLADLQKQRRKRGQ